MYTIEEIKKQELTQLEKEREIWSSDERGLDNHWVKKALETIDKKEENIDEYTRRQVVNRIKSVFAKLAHSGYENFFNPDRIWNYDLKIEKDEPITKKVNLRTVEHYGQMRGMTDVEIQAFYSELGYTDTLPTEIQIASLKRRRDDLEVKPENYKEIDDLDFQIQIARMARGEGLNAPFGFDTIAEIEEKRRALQEQKTL